MLCTDNCLKAAIKFCKVKNNIQANFISRYRVSLHRMHKRIRPAYVKRYIICKRETRIKIEHVSTNTFPFFLCFDAVFQRERITTKATTRAVLRNLWKYTSHKNHQCLMLRKPLCLVSQDINEF